MRKRLVEDPLWEALTAFTCSLYASWVVVICWSMAAPRGLACVGYGILMLFVFILAYGLAYLVLGLVVQLAAHPLLRGIFLALAAIGFLLGYGLPAIAMVIIALSIAFLAGQDAARDRDDAEGMQDFDHVQDAPADYLQRFPNPLWQRLKLESVSPLRMVEDTHEDFMVTVLELQHRSLSLLGNQRSTGATTFFIVHTRGQATRRIGWKPTGYQVSVDGEYLYMARAGQHPSIKDWRRQLGLATRATAALTDQSDIEATTSPRKAAPIQNVQDPRIAFLALIVFGLLPGVMVAYGASQLGDLLRYDFLLRCARPAEYGTVLFGREAWQYIALLMLPLPGLVMLLVSISRGMGYKRFAWRLIVDGMLIIALTVAGVHFAVGTAWRPSLADGTVVSCYGNVPNKKITTP